MMQALSSTATSGEGVAALSTNDGDDDDGFFCFYEIDEANNSVYAELDMYINDSSWDQQSPSVSAGQRSMHREEHFPSIKCSCWMLIQYWRADINSSPKRSNWWPLWNTSADSC